MIYYQRGSENDNLSLKDLEYGLLDVFYKIGDKKKVLIIPPDYTRRHSMAGELTSIAYNYYKEKISDILPATGTHSPMATDEIIDMFHGIPLELFRTHDWRNDIVTAGTVPESFINSLSEGKLNYSWPAQLNKMVYFGSHDLILSIGQVVPHEVIGMANYNKNLFIGTGGAESINKSHFLGAVYGIERILGRTKNPVRELLNFAEKNFTGHLPIVYILTVVGKDNNNNLSAKGLFIGTDYSVFEKAAELSLKVNFQLIDKPLKKVVVYLDPKEYKSTWLGNKSIYRTRMALNDNAELIILAPGIKQFGEDKTIDTLIRKYGYKGRDYILQAVENNDDLQTNLGAAAHLIHGSSEGRFNICYCTDELSGDDIRNAGFDYAPLNEMMKKYNPQQLRDGKNIIAGGEEVFFISNPALGLWSAKDKFFDSCSSTSFS
jgi:nickel-dependent lactate racemase